MNDAYLLTGGNMGDRLSFLTKAAAAIGQHCGTIVAASSIYETEAWGKSDQGAFLNQVLRVETTLTARELLDQILSIESLLGRKRAVKYGPRYIDIDILLFNDDVISEPGLSIPHPEMQHRRFALVPLSEIAASKIHPLFGKSITELLEGCEDSLAVYKFS
jgi:2-amino-4-hydroxy-6-hydroxymethyldihydropteridine diphosphokinase